MFHSYVNVYQRVCLCHGWCNFWCNWSNSLIEFLSWFDDPLVMTNIASNLTVRELERSTIFKIRKNHSLMLHFPVQKNCKRFINGRLPDPPSPSHHDWKSPIAHKSPGRKYPASTKLKTNRLNATSPWPQNRWRWMKMLTIEWCVYIYILWFLYE